MQVIAPSLHLVERAAEIPTNIPEDMSHELSNPSRDRIAPIFGDKDQMIIQAINDTSSSAQVGTRHG